MNAGVAGVNARSTGDSKTYRKLQDLLRNAGFTGVCKAYKLMRDWQFIARDTSICSERIRGKGR